MSTFQSFEDIEAWQESRRLLRAIREICKKKNVERDYKFVSQIKSAARSISHNIAEGSESLTIPDFINFLGIAKKSAGEVRSHLYDALDEEYITRKVFDNLADLTRKITSMLAKLIHYLQSLDQKQRRTQVSRTNQTSQTNERINESPTKSVLQ